MIFALVVAAHLMVLGYLEVPFIGLSLIWIVMFVWLISVLKRPAAKIIAVNLITILVALAGAEAYFWVKSRLTDASNFEQISSHSYQILHDELGYAPYPDTSRQVKKTYRGETLYTTTYTIDDVGLRVSPPENESGVEGTVLFFGGSFTYGEGVGDLETLPYQVGVQTDGRFRIRNLGFHGYGPQQMLVSLQGGLMARLADPQEPITVVYECGLFHARRAAGSVPWSARLPRYELDQDGTLRAAGFFEEYQIRQGMVERFVARSFLFKSLFGEGRPANSQEIDLFLGIVAASRDQLNSLYPGAEFHVVFWDDGNWLRDRKVIGGLADLGIETHLVSTVFSLNDPQYRISPYDRHPSAAANRELAEFVTTAIIGSVN